MLPKNTIRVVLNNNNFNSLFHDDISLSCDQGFTIKNIIDSQEYSFEKGDKVTIRQEGSEAALYHNGEKTLFLSNRWYIKAEDNGSIVIDSIHRSYVRNNSGTPYRALWK